MNLFCLKTFSSISIVENRSCISCQLSERKEQIFESNPSNPLLSDDNARNLLLWYGDAIHEISLKQTNFASELFIFILLKHKIQRRKENAILCFISPHQPAYLKSNLLNLPQKIK